MRELRPVAGSHAWWAETWAFSWVGPPAGFVRLAVLPRQRKAWFWAGVVRADGPYVLCRDLDLAMPASVETLELRGHALWTHAICETPFEHWTVAMEAYAVAMDDPTEAWRGERGERVGLAFDLEWECPSPPVLPSEPYELICSVNGTLQLDDDAWELSCFGRRSHQWGVQDAGFWRRASIDASQPNPSWAELSRAGAERGPVLVEADEDVPILWAV